MSVDRQWDTKLVTHKGACCLPQVRQQLGVQALIVAPAAHTARLVAAASLTFQQQLQLQPHPDHELTFQLAGATAGDCVLSAVDQTCGLMQALNLSPVLVLVGIARGPALSSGRLSRACK